MNKKDLRSVYLDYQASTPVHPRVKEAMLPFFDLEYGNPHSNDHSMGWSSMKAVQRSRMEIADFLGSDSDEVIFTSGATESNNLAIFGLLNFLKDKNKSRIIVSSIEHKCVLESAKAASRMHNFEIIHLAPNNQGIIEQSSLEDLIDDSVGLVSVMMVNNEIGTIQPIQDLINLSHKYGALFHSDASQAGTFIELNVNQINVDLLSISSHKIYGPKGVGALYIRREYQRFFKPLFYGGGQESGIRPGTIPTMLCVGLGEACKLMKETHPDNFAKMKNLSELFLRKLLLLHPQITVNGDLQLRHPGNLNILFSGYNAQSLLQQLQPKLAASTGSACTSGIQEPSYVLKALGLTDEDASCSIRFSFGVNTSEEEVVYAVEILCAALNAHEISYVNVA